MTGECKLAQNFQHQRLLVIDSRHKTTKDVKENTLIEKDRNVYVNQQISCVRSGWSGRIKVIKQAQLKAKVAP